MSCSVSVLVYVVFRTASEAGLQGHLLTRTCFDVYQRVVGADFAI